MKIHSKLDLSYCSNIHPGETWDETFSALQSYVPSIKQALSPEAAFGLGLRLSRSAGQGLIIPQNLKKFQDWLKAEDVYVFTMNGFPYGGFHRTRVKDNVHQPDWTKKERATYTRDLFLILAELIPDHASGGISTSPLTYKHWWKERSPQQIFELCLPQLFSVLDLLLEIKKTKGISLHLDIEPEPDGLLENSSETRQFFEEFLIPKGQAYLSNRYKMDEASARESILEHFQICYDVCHFAVAYEDHKKVLKDFEALGIKIGKFQISAALKAEFETKGAGLIDSLAPFHESTYLHQVIERRDGQSFVQYPDLGEAIELFQLDKAREWRIHFHVPVFLPAYGQLASTQEDILEVLSLGKGLPSTQLEVETYTWEVLPADLQMDLQRSIIRELEWVRENLS